MTATMSAPPVARQFPLEPGQRMVFENVSWDYYTRTLHAIEAAGYHYRVTFDQGRMEIMTTGAHHENFNALIGRMIERYGEERNIPVNSLGEATCRREDLQKGLQPDNCYYVTTPPPPTRPTGEELNLAKFPPPDPVIEVDITHGSIPKLPIYAALGVREIWQSDGRRIAPFQLQPDGRYVRGERSIFFPELSFDDFNRFIEMAQTTTQHEVILAFVASLRQSKPRQ